MTPEEKIIRGISKPDTKLFKEGINDMAYAYSLAFPERTGGYDPATTPNALTVSGRYILKDGQPYSLRGVSLGGVADASKTDGWIGYTGGTEAAILDPFLADSSMDNANIVRLPVHKNHYFFDNPPAYIDGVLDAHVQKVIASGRYAIVDWHPIEDWDRDSTFNNAYEFWEYTAEKYKDEPMVVFELFNEPVSPFTDTLENWLAFRKRYQPLVNMVRSIAPNLILMGSPDYATNVKYALDYPVAGDDLAYTYHAYPMLGKNFSIRWEDYLNSEIPHDLPVVFTEFGYSIGNNSETDLPNNPTYKEAMERFFKTRPWAGWTAWSYDPGTIPAMLAPHGASMKQWITDLLAVPTDFNYDGVYYANMGNFPWTTHAIADTDTTASAGKVSSLNGWSGYSWQQSDPTKQPSFGAKQIGNKQVIEFPGLWGNHHLALNDGTILQGADKVTIVIFAQADNTATNNTFLFGLEATGTIMEMYYMPGGQIGCSAKVPGSGVQKWLAGTEPTTGAFVAIMTVDTVNGHMQLEYDNQPMISVSGIGTGVNLPATGVDMKLGANRGANAVFDGGIGFVGITDELLTSEDFTWLKSWFVERHKYK